MRIKLSIQEREAQELEQETLIRNYKSLFQAPVTKFYVSLVDKLFDKLERSFLNLRDQ